jgi:hypothetical protein
MSEVDDSIEEQHRQRAEWYKRTGGPAAALPEVRGPDGEGITEEWPGLTIRDHFASVALQGLLASQTYNNVGDGFEQFIADRAFNIADAMLKAREE